MRTTKRPGAAAPAQGNRVLIGLSFSAGGNAAFLVIVNTGFCEESRLKDPLKD